MTVRIDPGTSHGPGVAELVFLLTVIATFAAAYLARRRTSVRDGDELAGRNLNRWLVGLSAGTTANSGFIVTAAVGLGYTYGTRWILLPIGWLLGDLIFWSLFPARLNAFGRQSQATTLAEILKSGLSGSAARVLSILCGVIVLTCLGGYTCAQWLAGEKFLTGALGLPHYAALGLFALIIVAYSSIGGFTGSVYSDTLQAFIRLTGTVVALAAVGWFALANSAAFSANLARAGNAFLDPLGGGTALGAVGFVCGFAGASIGFGLGQPQLVSRYLAGRSPAETAAARWIYIGFVQFTWIAMTVFGILLRGVMPDITDPEAGLSLFFQQRIASVATGIIVADVFATIASTSNGLLIAMAQSATHDFTAHGSRARPGAARLTTAILVLGVTTMAASLLMHGTVLDLALGSISLMGAGLAPAVMVKIMGWRHQAVSLTLAVVAGIAATLTWKLTGLSSDFNEAGIGILTGLIVNAIFARGAQTGQNTVSEPLSKEVRRQ
jgi:sodium/proline symporter